MSKPFAYLWAARITAVAAAVVLSACAPSSSTGTSDYTLTAQLPALFQHTRIVAAHIDVNGLACSVRIVTLDSTKAWTPVCLVKQDQPTFKSFSIAGQQVEFGAVGNTFRVLQSGLTSLPTPVESAASAAKPAVGGSVDTTIAPAALGPLTLPQTWELVPYAGQHTLRGQNNGFMITSATLTINGSQGTLAVTYKNTYAPLHLQCTVTANKKGDYTLLFNPMDLAKITGSGGYTIQLISEGQALSGNIWDSRGFDSWQPNLPPQWILVSSASN